MIGHVHNDYLIRIRQSAGETTPVPSRAKQSMQDYKRVAGGLGLKRDG